MTVRWEGTKLVVHERREFTAMETSYSLDAAGRLVIVSTTTNLQVGTPGGPATRVYRKQ